MNRETETRRMQEGRWKAINAFMNGHQSEMVFVLSSLAELNLLAIYVHGIEKFTRFDQAMIPIVLCVLPIFSLVAGLGWAFKRSRKHKSAISSTKK